MPPLDPSTALREWSFSPVVTGAAAGLALLYLAGLAAVRARRRAARWPWWRTGAFLGGLAVVVLATESSIGAYDETLFWVHMVQHLMLIMVAPVLLVLGRPVILAMHATRNPVHRWLKLAVRSRAVSVLTWPPVALALYAVTVIGTHLTSFMNDTLTSQGLHDGEHLLYLLAGYLFFLPLLGSEPIRWRLSYPGRLLLLALAMPVDTFAGVVLTQATRPLFPAYLPGRPSWAPGPVADLHAGGAVMWVGGDAIMLALFVAVFVGFLAERNQRAGAGRWLEGVRRRTLAEHAAGVGVPLTAQRDRGTVDDGDEHLAAYNAYLSALAKEGRTPG